MKLVDMTCPHCNAHLKVDTENGKAVCEHCGATILIDDEVKRVRYENAEDAGYQFEKGRQRAMREANRLNYAENAVNAVNSQSVQPQPKKRRTWLWVIGWIFIFPVPLTILMLRKKDMKPALKYGIIAAAWIVYLLIAIAGGSNNDKSSTEVNTPANTHTLTEVPTERPVEQYSQKPAATEKPVNRATPKPTSTVTAKPIIEVESIEINCDTPDLILGQESIVTATVFPENATIKSITWTSSDESVLVVDADGNFTAVGGGSATITATSTNGITATYDVTVDGTKRLMTLYVSYKRQDKNNIGDDWSYEYKLNGESITNSYIITVGEELTCWAKFTESDNIPDVGKKSKKYKVKEQDITDGFTITMDLYVEENAGPNSGQSAHFVVTFEFYPN